MTSTTGTWLWAGTITTCSSTRLPLLHVTLVSSKIQKIVGPRKRIVSGALLEHGCPNNWTFKNAFYFVGTVITTIGYGNVAPKTKQGKVGLVNYSRFANCIYFCKIFCVVYALFGVPYFYYLMKVTGNYLHRIVKTAGQYRFHGKKTTIFLYITIGFW